MASLDHIWDFSGPDHELGHFCPHHEHLRTPFVPFVRDHEEGPLRGYFRKSLMELVDGQVVDDTRPGEPAPASQHRRASTGEPAPASQRTQVATSGSSAGAGTTPRVPASTRSASDGR